MRHRCNRLVLAQRRIAFQPGTTATMTICMQQHRSKMKSTIYPLEKWTKRYMHLGHRPTRQLKPLWLSLGNMCPSADSLQATSSQLYHTLLLYKQHLRNYTTHCCSTSNIFATIPHTVALQATSSQLYHTRLLSMLSGWTEGA